MNLQKSLKIEFDPKAESIDKIYSKKILIVSFTGSTPHLETSLEITKRLALRNTISYVHLGKYVSRPTLYPRNLIKRKTQFIYRINRAKKYIKLGRLSIASVLLDFVNNDLLPGTEVSNKKFWSGLDKCVHELSPKNKNLLEFQ